MRGAALGLFLCVPGVAFAQDALEAAITLPDRTIFLSADNSASAVPMVARDGDVLQLTFAQLHLRFPLPPFLHLTLIEAADGWRVIAISYDDPALSIAATPAALNVTGTFSVTGDVLLSTPTGPQPHSIRIEITPALD